MNAGDVLASAVLRSGAYGGVCSQTVGSSFGWSSARDVADDAVIALIENRACEVGVAICNLSTFKISIGQFSDTIGFSKAVSFLHTRHPTNFIFSHNAPTDSSLFQVISQEFECVTLTSVNRRVFNESKGATRLAELSSSSESFGFITDTSNYLALGAAAALICFVEESLLCTLVPNAVRVCVIELMHYMFIDRRSAIALRILPFARDAGCNPRTLMGIGNKTLTPSGSRLYRSNVVQPLRDSVTLGSRQDAVCILIHSPSLLTNVRRLLARFSGIDVDRLIGVYSRDHVGSDGLVQSVVEASVAFRNILIASQEIRSVLRSGASDGLLRTISDTIEHCEVGAMLAHVDFFFDAAIADATSRVHSRRATGALLQVQHCFSLRSSGDGLGLLDVKRRAFSDAIEDVFRLCDGIKEAYNIPAMKVSYTAKRGYLFAVPTHDAGKLPTDDFYGRVEQARAILCTSQPLQRLNDKLLNATGDILAACRETVDAFLPFVRCRMGLLHALGEALALLDLLQSHATVALVYPAGWCRPTLVTEGNTYIEKGQALVECAIQYPNSFEFTQQTPMMLVTGPNASGKTTLLTCFAHLIVLAQIGCVLPASYATIRIADRIFAIVPGSDSVDIGTSSFLKEMNYLAQLAQCVGKNSIVLVDELGRGTSNAEGCAVACATAEWLADVGCHTIFTSHSVLLPTIVARAIGDSVRICHMRVSSINMSLYYHFELTLGQCSVDNYGLRLLASVGTESGAALLCKAVGVLSDLHSINA